MAIICRQIIISADRSFLQCNSSTAYYIVVTQVSLCHRLWLNFRFQNINFTQNDTKLSQIYAWANMISDPNCSSRLIAPELSRLHLLY